MLVACRKVSIVCSTIGVVDRWLRTLPLPLSPSQNIGSAFIVIVIVIVRVIVMVIVILHIYYVFSLRSSLSSLLCSVISLTLLSVPVSTE